MSPRLEEIVVFAIAAILVALFAWIYVRDPQKTTRLWMLGWIAVLVHFAAPALDNFFPSLIDFTWWLRGTTLNHCRHILHAVCFWNFFPACKARYLYLLCHGGRNPLPYGCRWGIAPVWFYISLWSSVPSMALF